MLFACLLPPALAAVVLAAHFYRAGNLALAGLAAAPLLALLFVPRAWAARVVQRGPPPARSSGW
ncbi:MAG: hypothetical protein IPF60_12460 [Betaproteobacteria bacterium]|nr:hypothetical protein [Betaproteobacteria bacterium]